MSRQWGEEDPEHDHPVRPATYDPKQYNPWSGNVHGWTWSQSTWVYDNWNRTHRYQDAPEMPDEEDGYSSRKRVKKRRK